MAVIDGILAPAQRDCTTAQLNATTSTSAIDIGRSQLFAIVATGAVHIAFGTSGMGAADANDHYIPSGSKEVYQMPARQTHIRIYNPGAGAINYYITFLTQAG